MIDRCAIFLAAIFAATGALFATSAAAAEDAPSHTDMIRNFVLARCLPSVATGAPLDTNGLQPAPPEMSEQLSSRGTVFVGPLPYIALIDGSPSPVCTTVATGSDLAAVNALADEWFGADPFILAGSQGEGDNLARRFEWPQGDSTIVALVSTKEEQNLSIVTIGRFASE